VYETYGGDVAFADICGDGTPEMLYVSYEIGFYGDPELSINSLKIFAFENGETKSLLTSEYMLGSWDGFSYNRMFTTYDGALYMYDYSGQAGAYTKYEKYDLISGQLVATDSIQMSDQDWMNPPVTYKHNGQTITESEYARLTNEILAEAKIMILEGERMYEESKLAELRAETASLQRIAMTYEESLAYLESGAETPSAPSALTARPTASTVLVNGRAVAFDAYNISDNNYFKLRDLAYVLSGTEKQFEVGWDAAANAISLASGQPYTPVGGEMTGKGAGDKTPAATASTIRLDGAEIAFTAYNIDGNNYFKLRDVGRTFDFDVSWDGAANTITIETDKSYTED
jgi:hypothetical protein